MMVESTRMEPPQKVEAIPIPDPTARTIEQLKSDIAASREVIEAKLEGSREVVNTRLGGMDKAIDLLQVSTNKIPAMVKDEVAHLDRLVQEKFVLIATQIEERDVQREVAAKDVKSAVDAAFAASKEAVAEQNKSNALSIAKSETATSKLLDGIIDQMKINTKTVDDKINDLKDRLTTIESKKQGASDTIGWIFGAAGFIVAIVTVVAFVLKHT